MSDATQTFDGEVAGPPPLTDEQLRQVPARRGVALLAGEGDKPIQLLTAADMRARVRNRIQKPEKEPSRNLPDLRPVTCKVAWKLAGGHFETDLYFFEVSRRLWPDEYTGMLSWKPPWFVHVDPSADVPRFSSTRRRPAGGGRHLGPFPTGKAAEAFCDILRDGFYLCRDAQALRNAPRGERCAYGQMGRCLGACHGRISMDAYRRVVGRAADFATGRRGEYLRELRERMQEASGDLRFEEAAGFKARLDRLAELDAPAYRHVAPLERFRFVLVQPRTARTAKVFFAHRGAVAGGEPLDYPPAGRQLRAALERMRAHAARREPLDEAGWWRMGLLSRQLFSAPRRRGLMLRWHEGLSERELGEAVRRAADAIGLRESPAGKGNTSHR
jgi:excinuclease ABC subunit C